MVDNTLYQGDCLNVLRDNIDSDSIDLIYIDPPFNSKRNYNIFFDDKEIQTQKLAFEDTWTLKNIQDSMKELHTIKTEPIYDLLSTYQKVAPHAFPYLVMMALRINEFHRVLKETGSFYLHCDPIMSHYLKTICDVIFGAKHFNSEIIWRRSGGFKRSTAKKFPQKNDIILLYNKTDRYFFKTQYKPHKPEYLKRFRPDEKGRLCRTDVNPTKGGTRTIYLDDVEGDIIDSIWDDIPPINPVSKERLGYPTQKPKALLERIINTSSKKDQIVLDGFCGCGTTVDAAEDLKRKWIGIDISPIAISLIKKRLNDNYGNLVSKFTVRGVPVDETSAIRLWEENQNAFQDWWLTELGVFSTTFGTKGADKGIDGIGMYSVGKIAGVSGDAIKIAFSVKGGSVHSKHIDELLGAMAKHKCLAGVFLTIQKPKKPMLDTVVNSGFLKFGIYEIPKLQILTLKEFFGNKKLKLPEENITFKASGQKTKQLSFVLG
jgi:site-specific DNA-methyltransferase (adenine-specific)